MIFLTLYLAGFTASICLELHWRSKMLPYFDGWDPEYIFLTALMAVCWPVTLLAVGVEYSLFVRQNTLRVWV